MKTLRYFDNNFSAELARGLLGSEGIQAVVLNQNTASVLPFEGAITSMRPYLAVADEDYEAAMEILAGVVDESALADMCPACGSHKLAWRVNAESKQARSGIKLGAILASLFLQPIPFNRVPHVRYCRDCGYKIE